MWVTVPFPRPLNHALSCADTRSTQRFREGRPVLTATTGLTRLRPLYEPQTRDMFRILLNATSAAEANLALEVLRQTVPDRVLVTACNLREVLRALPCSPFTMRVDETTLYKTSGFEPAMASMRKRLPDGIELVVTTAGNLVLDIIVKTTDDKYFWTPIPVRDDFVNPDVVDLVVESGYLLDEVIELVKCMGIVFNPRFYLSLEDFQLDYAADVMQGLDDLF